VDAVSREVDFYVRSAGGVVVCVEGVRRWSDNLIRLNLFCYYRQNELKSEEKMDEKYQIDLRPIQESISGPARSLHFVAGGPETRM
jgi:hypothetical protein